MNARYMEITQIVIVLKANEVAEQKSRYLLDITYTGSLIREIEES